MIRVLMLITFPHKVTENDLQIKSQGQGNVKERLVIFLPKKMPIPSLKLDRRTTMSTKQLLSYLLTNK